MSGFLSKEGLKRIIVLYYPFFYTKKSLLKIWFKICGSMYKKMRIDTKNLMEFQDKYCGDRCFIICTGPSLTIEDLELIRNEYSFSMNSIINIFDRTSFRPTFYFIQDGKVEKRLRDKLSLCYRSNFEATFIGVGNVYGNKLSISKKTAEKFYPNAQYYNNNMQYHIYDIYYSDYAPVEYSEDCSIEIKDGFTVTYSALEMAIYMGFKNIYLLGCDSNRAGHVDSENNSSQKNCSLDRNIQAYSFLYDIAKEKGINIYNATRGGMLEVFPRVSLESIDL